MVLDEKLSVPQAAALCGVSRSTINNWIKAKRLFARRSGKIYSIQTADLLFFTESMGKAIPSGLKNNNYAKPLFRSFRYCWDYWEAHDHSNGCEECVVSKNKLTTCFTARKSSRMQCSENCHECRYFKEIFLPRIQFIFQLEMPAAVCKGLYFWGANSRWAEVCKIPPEGFIGLDIEKVIRPESLGEMISLLKKRDIGEDFFSFEPILVQTEAGEGQRLLISIFALNELPGASLILARSGEDKSLNP